MQNQVYKKNFDLPLNVCRLYHLRRRNRMARSSPTGSGQWKRTQPIITCTCHHTGVYRYHWKFHRPTGQPDQWCIQ